MFYLLNVEVDLSGFISTLTGSIQPVHVISILISPVIAAMTFFLMWLGIRKVVSIFVNLVAYGRFLHDEDIADKKESYRQDYYAKTGIILNDDEINL